MKRKQLELIYGGRYEKIHAISTDFYNTCYYCGETATTLDHVPPISNVEFFIATAIPADFALVPSCTECNALASAENHAEIDERFDFVKTKLKKRYGKQIRRANLWTKEEIEAMEYDDGETSISKSIKATIIQSGDILGRLNFKGYAYEMRGLKNKARDTVIKKHNVFGVEYESFKSALQDVAKQYRVKISVLYDFALVNGGDIEKAVADMLAKIDEEMQQKRIKKLCDAVAHKYKKPIAWVKRSFNAIKNKNVYLSDNQCIDKLINDYILPSAGN